MAIKAAVRIRSGITGPEVAQEMAKEMARGMEVVAKPPINRLGKVLVHVKCRHVDSQGTAESGPRVRVATEGAQRLGRTMIACVSI